MGTDVSGRVVRVLVADDHPVVLDGVTLALQSTSWLQVAGYARNGREAVAAVDRLRPDVVLLDLRLPDMLGPEAIRQLLAHDPAVKIILFTAYPDHAALDAARAAGAHGVVVKDSERADLVDVIRRVVAGERVVSADIGGDNGVLLTRKLREHGLTRREYEILRHVAMGETNPEIARALGLTRNTVKTYLQRTLEKLGARNRVEALGRANQLGIL
jgi:two-component system, NarL family, nitrate/nitrite response regulator NarL